MLPLLKTPLYAGCLSVEAGVKATPVAFDAALSGQGSLMMVMGEPGMADLPL